MITILDNFEELQISKIYRRRLKKDGLIYFCKECKHFYHPHDGHSLNDIELKIKEYDRGKSPSI